MSGAISCQRKMQRNYPSVAKDCTFRAFTPERNDFSPSFGKRRRFTVISHFLTGFASSVADHTGRCGGSSASLPDIWPIMCSEHKINCLWRTLDEWDASGNRAAKMD